MCQRLKQVKPSTLLAIVIVTFGLSCSGTTESGNLALTPEQLEAEAQILDERLICPSCPGKTIGQAQVAQAAQMRILVREKLSEGWSRQQVLDYFSERYEGVLAEPPKEGFTLLAWLLPIVGIAGGGTVLYLVIRAMRRQPEPQPADTELGLYLQQVDNDLGRAAGTGPVAPPPDMGDL